MKHYVSDIVIITRLVGVPRVHPGDHLIIYNSIHSKPREVEMSDLEGNFDVVILGTGLVESIAAAYVMQSCPM